ncbi:glycoside hydrolase family 78 protein [Hyaloscypha variabilis F]|uniref:Glycoside hydrolase family 78 protein n=1 Tax=Hyaloscypha variabilis (strain UAMH 11265 / GT02V1 / F) TaxID=1149755 RepID=A0A2J6S8B3_HYAVF|nr:glycoside hydrolase family 78 protein [Hyaloscypha variabilis F]
MFNMRMKWQPLFYPAILIHLVSCVANAPTSSLCSPVGLALGSTPSSQVELIQKFQLTPSTPLATLDYGHEVAGYPWFNVESVSGKVQIEVKYSEEFSGLNNNFSDGPFSFAVGLANTYRVETFEVTETGSFQAYLIQGGQRWQSIRLLTSGIITFSSIGVAALNDIWKLGARAASAACVEQGTQKAIWDVGSDGTLVRGMRAANSIQGAFFEDYTLEFDAKIERAGFGWAVAHPFTSPTESIQLNLVGDLPEDTTFVNTNKSLTPPNSVLFGFGYSLINVMTLTSYRLDNFQVPFSIKENTWYTFKTVLSGGAYLSVSINETLIFNISLANYFIGGSSIPTVGSFGFGGWQDQAATIRNVSVYDTANQTQLYRNSMTDPNIVLPEYGVHENYASVCMDGAKRDRLVWLGDLSHTTRVIAASTSRNDIIKSTLQYFLDWQTVDGFLPFAAPLGYDSSSASTAFAFGVGAASGVDLYGIVLADYQILGLLDFANYISATNDLAFAMQTFPKWEHLTGSLLGLINSTTELVDLSVAFLGPGTGDDYGVSSMGFCITSGVANTTQASQFLSQLPNLKLGPGYKDSSQVSSNDSSINISPNTNGFLLEALLLQNTTSSSITALELMKSLWSPMVNDEETTTGASWEYVDLQGNPGLGLYTSLSYPWGGAPTYLLTEYVTGLQKAEGVRGYGYGSWVVDSSAGVAMGLQDSSARVVTAFNGSLSVQWTIEWSSMKGFIEAPVATSGIFIFGGKNVVLNGREDYTFTLSIT